MDNDYCYYLNFIDYVEGHFKQMHEVKEYAKARSEEHTSELQSRI